MHISNLKIKNKVVTQINIYESDLTFHKHFNELLSNYSSIFILTQESLSDSIINNITMKNAPKIKSFILEDAEKCKSEKQLKEILNFLLINQCNKDSLIVGIGGGSVSDITGFVSSIYMRGIKHILIPTTLLGMVDASIGGKTAINYNNIRNLIGTIKHPDQVLIFLDYLDSLPKSEILNGFSEIIKYALIMDKELFEYIEKNKKNLYPEINKKKLKEIIIKCIIHKVDIVQQDEKDLGHRRILNFGHTAGHALESYLNFQISHGLGVLYGMKVAAKISLELNKITKKQYIRITNLIDSFNIQPLKKINIDKILDFMYYDKKSSHNKINYVILNDIGASTINNNIDVEIIKKGLSSL